MTNDLRPGLLAVMRKLMVVVAVVALLGACSRRKPHTELYVPNTPEGNQCRRDCLQIRATCFAGRRPSVKVCDAKERECLMTCTDVEVHTFDPNAPPPPRAPLPVPEGAKCVAADLPEWNTASAAEKKQLMERCRAD